MVTRTHALLGLFIGCVCLCATAEEPAKPLTPIEARAKVGEEITVEMTVQVAKDRLEKRGEIYLDAETDFRDPGNFAVVITRAGAAALRTEGITDPAGKYMGKLIRARGVVTIVQEVPRIEVDSAEQIEIVELKP